MANFADAVKALTAKTGATRVNGLVVKSVWVKELEKRTLVTLEVNQKLDKFVKNKETEEYELGKVSSVYVTLGGIMNAIKENKKLSMIWQHFVEHPKALMVMLDGATIDVIQEPVTSGNEYINEFTGENKGPVEHDDVYHHVVRIDVGEVGKMMIPAILNDILGLTKTTISLVDC